jgi:hypothetical protein
MVSSLSSREVGDILREYCSFVDGILSEFYLKEGSLTHLLTENFSAKSFQNLVAQLSKLESMIPDEMNYTLRALNRAVNQSERDYAKLLRKTLSREEFSKSVVQTKGLVDSIAGALEELQVKRAVVQRLGLSDNGTLSVGGTSLSDVLDRNHRDILRAKVEQGFQQPSGMIGKLWKTLSPESYGWYGLTDRLLIDDIMGLTKDNLIALGNLNPQVIEDLFPQELEEELPEIVDTTDDPSPAVDEPQVEEEPEPEPEPVKEPEQSSKSDDSELSKSNSVSFNELIGKYGTEEITDKQKKAVIDILRKNGIRVRESTEDHKDRLVLERWRRLAGVNEGRE